MWVVQNLCHSPVLTTFRVRPPRSDWLACRSSETAPWLICIPILPKRHFLPDRSLSWLSDWSNSGLLASDWSRSALTKTRLLAGDGYLRPQHPRQLRRVPAREPLRVDTIHPALSILDKLDGSPSENPFNNRRRDSRKLSAYIKEFP